MPFKLEKASHLPQALAKQDVMYPRACKQISVDQFSLQLTSRHMFCLCLNILDGVARYILDIYTSPCFQHAMITPSAEHITSQWQVALVALCTPCLEKAGLV